MNILFISRNSPFESIGGRERYITNLIEYFKNNNKLKSRLYLMLSTSKEDYIEKIDGVTIYYNKSLFLSRDSAELKKQLPQKVQEFSESVQQIIKTENINIICAENFHIDIPSEYSLLLSKICISQKIPLVLQVHTLATTEQQIELINKLKWNKISCVSKSVVDDCVKKGINNKDLSTHYLGINTKEFNVDKTKNETLKLQLNLPVNSKIILIATRILRGKINILKEKGVINLIQAFSKLSPEYPDLKLLIAIGKPPETLMQEFNLAYEMLQNYINHYNVEKNTIIKMFGLAEMPDVYRGSDMFVLPSENETFGQVFIEAMSCGLPVIGTKVGGIPEIIKDNYNGFLVPPNDVDILTQKIGVLVNDRGVRERFINSGINTVKEKFTSDKQFLNFNTMLEGTITES